MHNELAHLAHIIDDYIIPQLEDHGIESDDDCLRELHLIAEDMRNTPVVSYE